MLNETSIHERLVKLTSKKIADDVISGYRKNDNAHSIDHAVDVYNNAVQYNDHFHMLVDESFIFLAAMFHDMFTWKDRKNHNVLSSEYVLEHADDIMNAEEISKACFEHRSSGTGEFSSNLSEVIAMGDNGMMIVPDGESVEDAAIEYVKDKIERGKTFEKGRPVEDVIRHLEEKYSEHGYATKSMSRRQASLPMMLYVFDIIEDIDGEYSYLKND